MNSQETPPRRLKQRGVKPSRKTASSIATMPTRDSARVKLSISANRHIESSASSLGEKIRNNRPLDRGGGATGARCCATPRPRNTNNFDQ